MPQTIFGFQIVLYGLQNGWKWISGTLLQLENGEKYILKKEKFNAIMRWGGLKKWENFSTVGKNRIYRIG